MPEWLGAILFVAAIFGVSFLWEALKDKAKAKGGKSAAAAKGAEAIGTGVEWGMRILLGVAALAVGLFFLWFGIKDGAWQGWGRWNRSDRVRHQPVPRRFRLDRLLKPDTTGRCSPIVIHVSQLSSHQDFADQSPIP